MVDLKSIDIEKLEPENYSHRVFIDSKRYREIHMCLACSKKEIQLDYHPFCKICHDTKIKNFPESFLPKERAFEHFCNFFDKELKSESSTLKKPKKPEWIAITIPLPFQSPFTVMDVEATGDMHRDKSQYVITMGYLNEYVAVIYQLINPKAFQQFARKCKNLGFKLPAPVVAYNKGSEMVWLKLFRWGWVELMNHEIEISKEGEIRTAKISLDRITFKWNDISGNDVIEEWQKYLKNRNLIHLKRIAYHNFIDLLKEYQIAIKSIKVHDYLQGKEWDYTNNELKDRIECQKCLKTFKNKQELFDHLKENPKHKKKRK